MSSACASIRSASSRVSAPRSLALLRDHDLKALFAAPTARSTSASRQRGADPTTFSHAGLTTSKVSPATAESSLPSTTTLSDRRAASS